MSMSIKMDGLAGLQIALLAASQEARGGVDRAVVATAIELRGDVAKRIQRGPATGTVYEKYSPRRTHQSSAPSESPATDTGRLANSIVFDKVGFLSATVGSDLVYARALEFGHTYTDGRVIEPRPAWVPAVEAITPKYIARLERALEDAFQ